jgi:hypothetical protein
MGSSESRLESKRVLTSAFVVFNSAAFSVTVTTSLTPPSFIVTSTTAV